MNDLLCHLSEEEIGQLIERYYGGVDKVAVLIREYKLATTPGKIYTLFTPRPTDYICPYCDVNMIWLYQPRTYNEAYNYPVCPVCKHEYDERCYCKL